MPRSVGVGVGFWARTALFHAAGDRGGGEGNMRGGLESEGFRPPFVHAQSQSARKLQLAVIMVERARVCSYRTLFRKDTGWGGGKKTNNNK